MNETPVDGELQLGLQNMCCDIQTKEFQCPICAKYFSRKFTLDAHMLIHKGEKPFMCQFCGKSFRQKGTLMRHKALHSTKHLFHCSLCNRGFRQKNVFIHHLRHRHNVSTETLDRRKYRTEPKDYQSIMDTLPPFVHADSTAIASSGKHFDALLSKSIQKSAGDSLEPSQYCVGDDAINSTINALTNSEEISITVKEFNELNSVPSHESELVIDEDYLEEIKPIFNNNACEVNPSMSSINSILPETTNSSMLAANSFSSQLNNVTSSNDTHDESIVCLPCHRSFSNETEFKCHMKTHVQSVLLGDVNSGEFVTDCCVTSGSGTSLNSVLPNSSSLPVSNSNNKKILNQKDNLNFLNPDTVPVKIEVSDSEMESCLSSKKISINIPMPSENELTKNSNLFCPVCKIFFQGEETFKKHAETHDSYLLLKSYSQALNVTDIPRVNQSQVSVASSKNSSIENHNYSSNKHSQKKLPNIVHSKPMKNVIKSKLNKHKSFPKRFQCMQCKKMFSGKTLLEYHLQLHLNVKRFSCGCCKKNFSSKIMLLSHTRLNHLKTFSCLICSRIFSYRKLFNLHKKKCVSNYDLKTSNGSQINFPVVSIESLLNSDADEIVGIIPVCNTSNVNGKNVKVGIPVMSVAQIKALYKSSNSEW